MHEPLDTYQVIIVGGGPVGLFLGCCLDKLGISCIILEKRTERITHSRSLGVHPVSLEMFDELGFALPFVEEGIKIFRGVALTGNKKLGSISFEDEALPFNFILSIPQFKTEKILESNFNKSSKCILKRGATLIDIRQQDENVIARYKKNDHEHEVKGHFLIGCDGRNSKVRELAKIDFKGKFYPDTYVMGDFKDNTNFGNDAAIYLHQDGLIESFPLPNGMRRWVVKTDSYVSNPTSKVMEDLIFERINHDLRRQENKMLSSFGVQKLLANPIFKKRVILAGDACHIVSPIGGQGMNLGWINAKALADNLRDFFQGNKTSKKISQNYASLVRRNTRKVVLRSELNMKLGRKKRFPSIGHFIVWAMLNTPLRKVMAKLFTMRKLDRWII